MSKVLHMQQPLPASPERVWHALTDAAQLTQWFAEHADISLADRRFDFWGRFTPDAPDRDGGRHPIVALAERHLRFHWQLRGAATVVELHLFPRGATTDLALWHRGIPTAADGSGTYALEDVWFMALENLRRHLDGRPVVRCDFSAVPPGDVRHSIDIAAPPAAVWSALTEPAQLERWIASRATVELRPGGRFDLGWGPEGVLEILALDAPRRLELQWGMGNTVTVVTWILEGSDGRTRLTLVHSGFGPDTPNDGLQVGWLHYLVWLQSLVEFGAGWVSAVKELSTATAPMYQATMWIRQRELQRAGEGDGEVQ